MPRKPTKQDDSEQSKRFLETAEQVEAEQEDALVRTFKTIVELRKETPKGEANNIESRRVKKKP
ncbi:MAG: hypothetical protein WBE48_01045 [Xanthobacteraceae bacterium]|jgi:hypothetical protein